MRNNILLILIVILLLSGCTNQVEVTNFPVQYNDVFVKIDIPDLEEGYIYCKNDDESFKGTYNIHFISINRQYPVFEKKTKIKGETRYTIETNKYSNIIETTNITNNINDSSNSFGATKLDKMANNTVLFCVGKIKGKANIIYSNGYYLENKTIDVFRLFAFKYVNKNFYRIYKEIDFYDYQIGLIEDIKEELIEEATK